MCVYDKAKWHYDGDFPKELSTYQAYVHIGLFLGWAINNGMVGELLIADFADDLASFKSNKITGPKLLKITDGVLDSQMLSDEGNLFAEDYYTNQYLDDYTKAFPNCMTAYHVPDIKDSASVVSGFLDVRYKTWKCT